MVDIITEKSLNESQLPINRAPNRLPHQSLSFRSDQILLAIAILGLTASVADGLPDSREIDLFLSSFKKRFVLSDKKALRITQKALRKIRVDASSALNIACHTINENLTLDQKIHTFDLLVEILLVDRKVCSGEEYFLDYIAVKLAIGDALEERLKNENS